MNTRVFVAIVLALCVSAVLADLPVHCEFPQIKGTWVLRLTNNDRGKEVVDTCELRSPIEPTKQIKMELKAPNVVVTETGDEGTWTLIYDQGFEIIVGKQRYLAFFNFTQQGQTVISDCSHTLTGWYHEDKPAPVNWGCFRAEKIFKDASLKHKYTIPFLQNTNTVYKNDPQLIKEINTQQNSWVAGENKDWEGMPLAQLYRQLGKPVLKFRRDAHKKHVQNMRRYTTMKAKTMDLPKSFDWRNISGVSYVNDIRNQQSCGSCFAFATMAMYESRARIATRNKAQPYYSPQDIVSCCKYSQGCDGGFPLLVSKYAFDFGIVEEKCNPYKAHDGPCEDACDPNARRYASDYTYIGGYYGNANEQDMMEAIYEDGPIVVGIEVYRDFMHYKSGIYHHINGTLSNAFGQGPDPHFEVLNHAVVLTGWGQDESTGEKYWILRNSWGTTWGMGGYAYVRRGVDESGIESEATDGHLIIN